MTNSTSLTFGAEAHCPTADFIVELVCLGFRVAGQAGGFA